MPSAGVPPDDRGSTQPSAVAFPRYSPTADHSFPTPVDLPAALDRLHIEYLDVHTQRLLVIYNTAIFNVEVTTGNLSDAQAIMVELWEPPSSERSADSDPESLLDQFIDDIVSMTATDDL